MDFYPKAFWDTFPQDLLKAYPKELIKCDLFRFNFKQKLGNEYFTKDGKKLVLDSPFDTFEDLVIGLEFQSYKLDYYRKTVFYEYQANLHMNNKKDVRMVVFSTVHKKHKLLRHRVGPNEEFTMLIISLKALYQKQTINNCLYKISNNISMSNEEKALFLLSPMMDSKNNIKALDFIMDNFYKINDLSQNELEDMKTIIWLYIEKWCKKEIVENDGGVDVATLTPGAKKIKEEIFNQGIEKERICIISSILSNGLSFEEVSRLTGLSVDEISEIANGK